MTGTRQWVGLPSAVPRACGSVEITLWLPYRRFQVQTWWHARGFPRAGVSGTISIAHGAEGPLPRLENRGNEGQHGCDGKAPWARGNNRGGSGQIYRRIA